MSADVERDVSAYLLNEKSLRRVQHARQPVTRSRREVGQGPRSRRWFQSEQLVQGRKPITTYVPRLEAPMRGPSPSPLYRHRSCNGGRYFDDISEPSQV